MPPNLLAWLPIAAGLLFIAVPTFVELATGIWKSDRNAHGPIVLAVSLWFLGFKIRQMLAAGQLAYRPAAVAGWSILGFGLICYVLGRSQGVYVLEVGAFIPIVAGCVAMFFGLRALRRLWFAFFFMLFFIPLPASVVDGLTQPMKIGVSYVTEHVLYWMGYPIARSGVLLNIGQYQLLVADACAGLHSLFTLEALGLLYMNLVGHDSFRRNLLLGLLIVPISFASNVLRVIALTLITYYLGDAAGQGFLHGFAGMLLFLTALFLIICVDSLLGWWIARRERAAGSSAPTEPGKPSPASAARPSASWRLPASYLQGLRINLSSAVPVAALMLVASACAWALKPDLQVETRAPDLARVVPTNFGEWREIPSPYVQADIAVNDEQNPGKDYVYDAVLMRTYANQKGEQVMLALAYGTQQRQDVKIHRPEVCYESQGFRVSSPAPVTSRMGRGDIQVTRMLAESRSRLESVSYWVRVGKSLPSSGSEARWYIFREGMKGRIPDGILVRASSILASSNSAPASYGVQEEFLSALVAALPPESATLLVP